MNLGAMGAAAGGSLNGGLGFSPMSGLTPATIPGGQGGQGDWQSQVRNPQTDPSQYDYSQMQGVDPTQMDSGGQMAYLGYDPSQDPANSGMAAGGSGQSQGLSANDIMAILGSSQQ